MLIITNKIIAVTAASAIATTLLLAGNTLATEASQAPCIKLQKSENGMWEYVRNWHDGYNLHPYAKIKVEVGADGALKYRRDNATGLLVFKDISEAEYAAVGCLKM
ncbi:hypothetical protein [Hydrogenimonas sp.]